MSSSVYYLTEVLENGSFHISIDNSLEKLEIFRGQGRLIISVVNYIMKLCFLDDKVIALLKCLDDSAWSCENDTTIEGNNCFSKLFMSFLQELREFFTVPKQQMSKITPAPNPNEFVGVFIPFLLQILEEILQLEPDFIVSVKGSIEVLRTELGFLITYLGDTPSQSTEVEETKNVLTYIEAVVNEVGNCLYSFFFTRDDQVHVTGILDLALSDLLQKFELMKAKIKNHCITVSKMPTCMTPKTCVVSLFIVDSLLDDLQELINLNSDSTDDVNDQIRALHQELTLLRSSLSWDLPVLQNKEHEELVIQTRDIAYEIEYIINSFPPVWYLTVRLPQFMEKMKLIGLAIKDINNIAGIQEVEEYSSDQVSSQIKELSISEEIFVGFENEATEIAEKLVRGPQQLEIISIFGMPGLGKTTLAKKLYSDPSVVYHFDNRAWCVVSQTYQKRNMLIDILRTIGHHNLTDKEDETLAETLYKSLSGRRYLVVLDDIWDINAWDDLSRYFPDNRTGSRIVFTTRHKEVGLKASHRCIIYGLRFLSDVECWDLLKQKVFKKECCPPELVDIGKQIATSCRGLPLTVVVLAAVLAKMEKKKSFWQTIVGSLSSLLSQDPYNCINNILELSYKHLPMNLKPCFLYFGAFEKDREIPVQKLISLWVAEGFIKKEENKNIEDVANEYLMDLIDRSLVLVVNRRSDIKVETCNIHDLLHDMCLRIAKEEVFLKVVENQLSMYEQHHRLRIDIKSIHSYSRPFVPHVRSLVGRLHDLSRFILFSFKLVRVLDLSSTKLEHLDLIGIEQLVHLRYLAFPCSQLPSLESLHKLEYLIVDNKELVEIPESLFNMVNLRHLNFSGGAHFSKSCYLRATNDEYFKIDNLQYISVLYFRERRDLEILRCFPNLCGLEARVTISQYTSRPYNLCLDYVNQLESLILSDSLPCSYFRPHHISLPLSLRELSLFRFDFSWKQMRIIGRLPNLENLKLVGGSIEGEKWDTTEGEFPQLKFLELESIKFAKWNTSSDHYPRLERLLLRSCYHLEKIPSCLVDILTLRMILVSDCKKSAKESAIQIRE